MMMYLRTFEHSCARCSRLSLLSKYNRSTVPICVMSVMESYATNLARCVSTACLYMMNLLCDLLVHKPQINGYCACVLSVTHNTDVTRLAYSTRQFIFLLMSSIL